MLRQLHIMDVVHLNAVACDVTDVTEALIYYWELDFG